MKDRPASVVSLFRELLGMELTIDLKPFTVNGWIVLQLFIAFMIYTNRDSFSLAVGEGAIGGARVWVSSHVPFMGWIA